MKHFVAFTTLVVAALGTATEAPAAPSGASAGQTRSISSAKASLTATAPHTQAWLDQMVEFARSCRIDGKPLKETPWNGLGLRLDDTSDYMLEAVDGELLSEKSTHTLETCARPRKISHGPGEQGFGSLVSLPFDASPTALQQGLWQAAESALQMRLREQVVEQARQAMTGVSRATTSLAKTARLSAPVNRSYVELAEPLAASRALIRLCSAASRSGQTSKAHTWVESGVRASQNSTWWADSQGSRAVVSTLMYLVRIVGHHQDAKGREITVSASCVASRLGELPREEALQSRARSVHILAEALGSASTLEEDYVGPVLFQGHASATLVAPLFLDRTLQNTPVPSRTLLPTFLDVINDPTLCVWEGTPLLGCLPLNELGQLQQKRTVVDHGRLVATQGLGGKGGLKPSRGLLPTNNNMEALATDSASLIFKTHRPGCSETELESKALRGACRSQGLDFGLLVRTIDEPNLVCSGRDSLLWYKVDVKTGRTQLLRDCTNEPITPRVLRRITHWSSKRYATYVQRYPTLRPYQVVAPSFLVGELEVSGPPPGL